MKKWLKRLREPSTYAGLSAIGVLVGLPPGTVDVVLQAIVGIAAAAAVLLPESSRDA